MVIWNRINTILPKSRDQVVWIWWVYTLFTTPKQVSSWERSLKFVKNSPCSLFFLLLFLLFFSFEPESGVAWSIFRKVEFVDWICWRRVLSISLWQIFGAWWGCVRCRCRRVEREPRSTINERVGRQTPSCLDLLLLSNSVAITVAANIYPLPNLAPFPGCNSLPQGSTLAAYTFT